MLPGVIAVDKQGYTWGKKIAETAGKILVFGYNPINEIFDHVARTPMVVFGGNFQSI